MLAASFVSLLDDGGVWSAGTSSATDFAFLFSKNEQEKKRKEQNLPDTLLALSESDRVSSTQMTVYWPYIHFTSIQRSQRAKIKLFLQVFFTYTYLKIPLAK